MANRHSEQATKNFIEFDECIYQKNQHGSPAAQRPHAIEMFYRSEETYEYLESSVRAILK